jgi:hypothetical protein
MAHGFPINTETIYREGESPARESAAKIGGAAVGGAVLGAIFGGKKGASSAARRRGGGGLQWRRASRMPRRFRRVRR